ncbi:MATE family efflux transporter [Ruminococcus flavefaciens]|uniref:MATE family efflux transporter n=1 Tax=Ruminococcus flavefaciens TaxID=1265 RepID=UPI0026ED5627|nr:MATE family efflux transporter [Ruminococcus flavefaciens]MDD7515190.1 MATE family efflux transporter [Ruminococcus flavefaciens]MDY5691615.1 MATE family efflux transporter [Ruminococcus flavefaciens]
MQDNKGLYKKLFTIVAPIAFQYLMMSLVSASDAFMLGFLDSDSLSASSLAGQIAFVYSLFFGAFVAGCNVIAAQYWGKKDIHTVEEVLAITMRYSLLIGALFTLAALLIPQQIMRIFTSDGNLIRLGAVYLRYVALSYVLAGFSQAYFGIMKICDRAGLSSLIGSLAVILNILLNACLIFGLGFFPKMGIAGAAIATVAARAFECIFILVVMLNGKCPMLRIKAMFHTKDPLLNKDYIRYTMPLLLNQLGWGGGVTMYSVIMGHLGSDAVAANSMASIVRSMIASLCWGIASGVGIIIGGMLGRNEIDEAKKAGGKFVRLSIWIGVGSGVVVLAVTPLLMSFVTLNEQARYYLKFMMFMAAYYIIGNSLNSTIISGIFPAGGDTRFGMICDIVTLWCVVVPMGMTAAFLLKLPVLVVAFILTLDEFVKIPAVYKHYMKYKWLKNIT